MQNITIDQVLKRTLQRFPEIKLAILFGSLATNTASAESDLDLAVLSDQALDATAKMKLISALADVVGRPIDLIDIRTAGEPLMGQVFKGRRILGSKSLYAQYLSRHLIDAADFLPYQQRILKERRDRWITS